MTDSGREAAVVEHELRDVIEGPGFASRCTCGWESISAHSQRHAERRWEIHFSQQRAAMLCGQAWVVGTTTRERTMELTAMREATRQRRSELAQRRLELRAALDRAARAKCADVVSVERTLECARELAGLTPEQLWMDYFAYGGTLGLDGLLATLRGAQPISRRDYDVLSTVLNEHFRNAGFGDPLPMEYRK